MHKQLILLFLTLIWLVNGRDREQYDDDQDRSNRGRSRYSNDPDRSNRGRHRYNSNHDQFYNCQRYENKIYQLKVTFPGKEPLYAGLRLQSYGTFDELFSIAGGNNADELGASFALSNRVGYYKCLAGDRMQATGYGYLYKTNDVQFLKDNGAVVMHDYLLKFSDHGRRLTGKVKFAVFKNGENPFTTKDKPELEGELGEVEGEILKFKRRFSLSL